MGQAVPDHAGLCPALKARNYEKARSAAQRFLDFYPGDEDAAYAQYLLALSFYDQIDEVGRDQGLTFQALQGMREVIEVYPDSEYATFGDAQVRSGLRPSGGQGNGDRALLSEKGPLRRSDQPVPRVVQDFQTTTHTAEALHRLVEAYLALGLTDEAQTAGAILGTTISPATWYDDSFRLLQGRGLSNPRRRAKAGCATVYRQVRSGAVAVMTMVRHECAPYRDGVRVRIHGA
jgi:outer membrane protein assembly factor BamD